MKVELNNREVEVANPTTLAELLAAEHLGGPGTAVAVDGKVVTRVLRASAPITDGMKILVIKAVCGG